MIFNDYLDNIHIIINGNLGHWLLTDIQKISVAMFIFIIYCVHTEFKEELNRHRPIKKNRCVVITR